MPRSRPSLFRPRRLARKRIDTKANDNIMMRNTIFLGILLITCAVAAALQPGDPFKPGKLPAAEVAALQPGMTLRFYGKPGDKTPLDTRRVRLAALHVPADSAPTPFLAPGPIHAKLTGYIKTPLKGMYSFRLHGSGTIALKINEKQILTLPADKDKSVEVELAKNYNRIEITCTSPEKGDTTVRLYWSGEKFGFEPVPPDVLSSRNDEADLVEKTTLREGRELVASRHCANCHAIAPKDTAKMPELGNTAPKLDDAGQRFNADWLAAWILNPREMRPDSAMPAVLSGPDAAKHAADIAAYLMTLKSDAALKPINAAGKAGEGEALFKKLGCVTCHRLDDPTAKDDLERLSLKHVGAKFAPNALQHFLTAPHKRYAWTRMPDFMLSDAEVGQLDTYLRNQPKTELAKSTPGDPTRGAKLFGEVGCARCHDTQSNQKQAAFPFVAIKSFNKGCLAEKDHGKAPYFALKESQRNALAAFLKTDGASLTRETPAEFSLRQVKALQCASCHRRDGESTRWHTVLEDDGKVPENLPSLTWIGEKLHVAWAKKMLAGEYDHRARPWLKARMPAFPARAEMLAVGLSHEHGFAIDEDERPKPDAKLAAIGEKLIPQQGGFHCNNCHGIGKIPAKEPFEAPGINLLDAAVRLRYHYYQRWMTTPDRVDVTMRMPIFAADGKTTQIREVFDGDARKQYDALWHYIQTLPTK
jgi:mono/diheme cytochrome c family protein